MECHKGFGTLLVQEFILSKVVIFVGYILVGRVSNLRGIVWTSNWQESETRKKRHQWHEWW